ncbi:MAG: hypothetical protein C5B47_01825 [Verrucomicrobia bacterium]|nr:MAG: hypothetical protein C5B47_01825 [Verrucomicrobiota bacterium]
MNDKFFYPEPYAQSRCAVLSTVYGPVLCDRDSSEAASLFQTGRALNAMDITRLSLFLNRAPERGVCLDIGAGYGLFALTFARALASKKGMCHAFEAQRLISYMAAGTAVLNGMENLCIHNRSIGSSHDETPTAAERTQCSGTTNDSEVGSAQCLQFETAPQITLDSLKFRNVYLIRISVGGMEKAVLEGAQVTVMRDKPILYIRADESNIDQLVGFCKCLEYQLYRFNNYFLCFHRTKLDEHDLLKKPVFADILI